MNWLSPDEVKAWLDNLHRWDCDAFTLSERLPRAAVEALEQFVRALAATGPVAGGTTGDQLVSHSQLHLRSRAVARLLVEAMGGGDGS